jgi:hypothetical protein
MASRSCLSLLQRTVGLPCPPFNWKVFTQVLSVCCPYNRGQMACLVLHPTGKFPRMSSQFSNPTTADSWPALFSIQLENFHKCPHSFLSQQQRTDGMPCPLFRRKVVRNVLTVSCPYNRGQLDYLVLHSIGKFPNFS